MSKELEEACKKEAKKVEEVLVLPKDKMAESLRKIMAKTDWKQTPLIFDDEHKNKMVIDYNPVGAWQDVFTILVNNGYEVTARIVKVDLESHDETIGHANNIEISWGDKK